jgi:hypothetical protein
VVGDVCSVVVTSVTVGLVVLTDTVVGPWVDVLTSGEVVECTEVGSTTTSPEVSTSTQGPTTVSVSTTSPTVTEVTTTVQTSPTTGTTDVCTEVGGCVTTDV